MIDCNRLAFCLLLSVRYFVDHSSVQELSAGNEIGGGLCASNEALLSLMMACGVRGLGCDRSERECDCAMDCIIQIPRGSHFGIYIMQRDVDELRKDIYFYEKKRKHHT